MMDHNQDAGPEMREAMYELRRRRINFEQTSQYQLKIDVLNYYPRKGTIYRDGDKKALKERGLEAFLGLISNLKKDRSPRHEAAPESLDMSRI